MLDGTVTRTVFEGLGSGGELVFYLLALLATLAFAVGIGLRVRKYLRGRRENRIGGLGAFVGRALNGVWDAASNRTVAKRDLYAGVFHAAMMWGFVVLFIGTVILTIDTDIVGFFAPQLHFFHGPFYVVYSFVLDLLGLAMLVGLVAMAWRRARFRTPATDYARVDLGAATTDRRGFARGDWILLGWLFVLGVTGFVVEAVRIVGHGYPWFESFSSPIGSALATGMGWIGLRPGEATLGLHTVLWWTHAGLALGFVAYFPFAKSIHILADGANLVFRSRLAGRRLAELPMLPAGAAGADGDGHIGLRDLADFSWKQLLDLDACTKCGRCHSVCPAAASGAPLSPRDLILDLRQQADAAWSVLAPGSERRSDLAYGVTGGADAKRSGGLLAGGLIKAETLWSCTTCLACVEACPVGIEHVPAIVGMRRSLVDQGEVEPGLQTALISLGKQGNSFGVSGRTRGKWTEGLPTPIRDARREPVDWLWFVGDYASFDVRVQEATRLVARILDAAGVSFGILYEGERNAGNDVRRAGEEGLFEVLMEHNVGALSKARFRNIVTTDPHTLNTLRHEYPQLGGSQRVVYASDGTADDGPRRGGSYQVLHYSELLASLLRAGRLSVTRPVRRRVTYHDPCYLARYAEVTQAPRDVLEMLGAQLVEMPRNRSNTFCCGAGGGRIWMDDSGLAERPSEQRMREAGALRAVTDFVTACPKDLTMYTAAAKATGLDGQLVVRDLVELLAEAMELPDAALPGAELDAIPASEAVA